MNTPSAVLPVCIVFVALLTLALSVWRLRRLGGLSYRKWRRVTERVILSLIILVCGAATLTTAYNTIAVRYNRSNYEAPGRLYDVGGYRMHLYCTGEGAPTLVLDPGIMSSSLVWGKVQPQLSKTTRVCSYDRAGMGWSAPRPGPQDADQIAIQLHDLLRQAGATGPIVLMGHSAAGLYIRDYASHYPENLVGLIFVDSSTPKQEDHWSRELRTANEVPTYKYYLLSMMYALGIPRVAGQCSQVERGFDEHIGRMWAEERCSLLGPVIWREYKSFRQSSEETIRTGPYGDLPILIFSRDP